jgi:hypothetical protein
MISYSVPLDIDLPLFNTELNPLDFLKSQPAWADNIKIQPLLATHFTLNWRTNVSQPLQEFFYKHGQEIRLCEIFFRYPNTVSPIHSDTKNIGDYSKINWILGGEDSTMHWYVPNDKFYNKTTEETKNKTLVNSHSIWYTPEEVDLVYSENIRGPAIVQVGTPHNITNGNQYRFCVSIVFRNAKNGARPTMTEATEIFKQYR